MFVKITPEPNGIRYEVDGSPASLIATLFDPKIVTANYGKRLSRVEKLSQQIGAVVYYPMCNTGIGIHYNGSYWECKTLRQAEKILRYIAKR